MAVAGLAFGGLGRNRLLRLGTHEEIIRIVFHDRTTGTAGRRFQKLIQVTGGQVLHNRPPMLGGSRQERAMGWLLSCDDEALAQGVNIAVLGGEVLQFGAVEPLGQGRFRLSHLLRGQYGTESAVGAHALDELFALIERDALRAVDLPQWTIGTTVKATARNVSGSVSESAAITIVGPHRETVTSPVGGVTVDGEARSSIDQILTALKQHGLIAS